MNTTGVNGAILKINVRRNRKMGSIKEEAQAYEPPQTLNISQLDKIPVNLELKTGEGKDKDGNQFTYKYVDHLGKQYRVPGSVLGGIKAILKKMPHIQYVTVDKEGEGMSTRYHVMPYVEAPQETVEDESSPFLYSDDDEVHYRGLE